MGRTDEEAPPPGEAQCLPLVPRLGKRAYLLWRHGMRMRGDGVVVVVFFITFFFSFLILRTKELCRHR